MHVNKKASYRRQPVQCLRYRVARSHKHRGFFNSIKFCVGLIRRWYSLKRILIPMDSNAYVRHPFGAYRPIRKCQNSRLGPT